MADYPPPFLFGRRPRVAAVPFYLLFLVGLVVLVILPAVERQSFDQAVFLGALFGLVTYPAYDLTNLATLDGFPLKVALVDLVWGSALCATVSAMTVPGIHASDLKIFRVRSQSIQPVEN